MTKILAFDTATEACSVALSVNGEVYEQYDVAPRQHASLILGMVDHLLTATEMKLMDLDAIAFGCGPGSFMGLRIAAGVAQGLAFGAGKPVIAVSSLQALAHNAHLSLKVPQIMAGWDARMNEIYWGLYRADAQGIMQPIQSEKMNKPSAISVQEGSWLAVGNAWTVYDAELSATLKSHIRLNERLFYPRANALLRIANDKFHKGEVLMPEKACPLYLRDAI